MNTKYEQSFCGIIKYSNKNKIAKTSNKKIYLFGLITGLLMCVNTVQAAVIEQICDQQTLRGENIDLDGRLTLRLRTTTLNDNILTTDKTISKIEAFYAIHPGIYSENKTYAWESLTPTTIIFSKHSTPAGPGFRIAQMMKDTRRNPLATLVPWTWTFPSRYDYREVRSAMSELGYGFFSGKLTYKSKEYNFSERKMNCSNVLSGTSKDSYLQPLYSDNSIYNYSAKQSKTRPRVYWLDNENGGVFETSINASSGITHTEMAYRCPANINPTKTPLPVGISPTDAGSATTTAPDVDYATPVDDICGGVQLMTLKDKELREIGTKVTND